MKKISKVKRPALKKSLQQSKTAQLKGNTRLAKKLKKNVKGIKIGIKDTATDIYKSVEAMVFKIPDISFEHLKLAIAKKHSLSIENLRHKNLWTVYNSAKKLHALYKK